MAKNIWNILGMKDITFFPDEKPHLKERRADLSTLNPSGGISFALPNDWDINAGCKECLGGGGLHASADAFTLLLQAALREDPKLLSKESWEVLFAPQLDKQCADALNQLLLNSPEMQACCGINVPATSKKNWSFCGLLSQDDHPGWMKEDTVLWGGVPSMMWFIDRKAGFCGFAGAQMVPTMAPPIMKLHESFQRGIFALAQTT